jgi:hypothetical protein
VTFSAAASIAGRSRQRWRQDRRIIVYRNIK